MSIESVLGIEKVDWVQDTTKRHTALNLGSSKKRVGKASNKKPTAVPSVEPPHPGLSYNPSLEDHQNLLKEIIEKEKKIMKEEEHLNRVTKDMLKKVPPAEKQVILIKNFKQIYTFPCHMYE